MKFIPRFRTFTKLIFLCAKIKKFKINETSTNLSLSVYSWLGRSSYVSIPDHLLFVIGLLGPSASFLDFDFFPRTTEQNTLW